MASHCFVTYFSTRRLKKNTIIHEANSFLLYKSPLKVNSWGNPFLNPSLGQMLSVGPSSHQEVTYLCFPVSLPTKQQIL